MSIFVRADESFHFPRITIPTGIYRGCYPPGKKWPRADCMEMETLIFTFNKKFLTESSQWHADITLGQLVELAVKQCQVKGGSTD